MNIEKIPDEINVHRKIIGKDLIEVDYDSIGPCPFCNSRIDEFNFCACDGNHGRKLELRYFTSRQSHNTAN